MILREKRLANEMSARLAWFGLLSLLQRARKLRSTWKPSSDMTERYKSGARDDSLMRPLVFPSLPLVCVNFWRQVVKKRCKQPKLMCCYAHCSMLIWQTWRSTTDSTHGWMNKPLRVLISYYSFNSSPTLFLCFIWMFSWKWRFASDRVSSHFQNASVKLGNINNCHFWAQLELVKCQTDLCLLESCNLMLEGKKKERLRKRFM